MKMKKTLSLLMSVVFILSSFSVPVLAADIQPGFQEMSADTFIRTAAKEDPLKNIYRFDRDLPRFDWGKNAPEPATLQGVTYALANNVVAVGQDVTGSIRSVSQVRSRNVSAPGSIRRIIDQGGLLKADQLMAATGITAIKPGQVFVDVDNDLAFKVPTQPASEGEPYAGYVPVIKPELQEVIKDFKIPGQTVQLNQSNVAHFASDANGNGLDKYLKKPGQTYVMSQNTTMEAIGPTHLKNIIAEFYFPSEGITVSGTTPSGGEVAINIKGYLGIGDMTLDGYYDKWDYAFYFSVAEEMQLQATLAAELKEEVRIPILGVDVGSNSKIGSIAGGLFLIVGVDGDFTLQVEARQWTTLNKVGLKGSNFFYVPCSIRPLIEFGDCGFTLDSQFNGAVNGYVKGGALLELNVLGLDLVGGGVFAGMGASTVVSGEYLEADLYGLVQAYLKFLGKTKHIINWQPTILHKKQMNTAGYIVTFKEVCAYRDEVWGTVMFDAGTKGNIPEPNKDIVLWVKDTQGHEASYNDKTDENGNFHFPNVKLRKDDDVYVRLQERNGTTMVRSDSVTPTFPFDSIIVQEADFFNDYVRGYVPSVIVKDWDSGSQKEMVFEADKSEDCSITLKLSNREAPVTLDERGFFDHVESNVLPGDKASCQLKFDGWVVKSNEIIPTVEFQAQTVRMPISYEKVMENGKPVDITKINETIFIRNMRGEKQYTESAAFTVKGYTQASTGCYLINPDTGLPMQQEFGIPEQTNSVKLKALLEATEDTFGESHFSNTIVKKWYWEPKPSQPNAMKSIGTGILPRLTVPKAGSVPPAINALALMPVKELNSNRILNSLPQHSITLSFDDPIDSYGKYPYNDYKELSDGSYTIRWDDKIVLKWEGAQIVLEIKDYRRDTTGDSKFEKLSGSWTGKNVELMLNEYMERMQGSLVFPMPDQMNEIIDMNKMN